MQLPFSVPHPVWSYSSLSMEMAEFSAVCNICMFKSSTAILVLEFNYNIRIWITIFISNGYYQFAQALAYQKKGYLWREPHCAMKCWGQVGLQGFLRLRQNESVFWAECHLEEFARLLRGIFFYCCFHFSFQRASLQRSNILSGLDLAEGVWSFNFFMSSMQKGTFI